MVKLPHHFLHQGWILLDTLPDVAVIISPEFVYNTVY